jgi:uncharacterized protein involved in exopolysaccharide biosynthesis
VDDRLTSSRAVLDRATPPEPPPALPVDGDRRDETTVVGPLESVLRHPRVVALPLVALVALALAIGIARPPQLTAEARVNVGRVDVPAYTLQGVITGNATLAASYARAMTAEAVVRDAARRADTTRRAARDGLAASPIPGSTLILVEGRAGDEDDAVALANGGARALIRYVTRLNRRERASGLLEDYRAALADVSRAERRVRRLTALRGADSPSVARARRQVAAARLEVDTVGNQYRAAEGTGNDENLLQLIAPAATAASDRFDVLQRLLLLGLVAGALLGIALALLRANGVPLPVRRLRPA